MSKKIVQLNEEVIKGEIKELVRGSVEETLNELLEQEAEKLTQAARYERNEARKGYRSGHYDRNLTTTSGDVTPHVPRLKGVSFETAIIERYRRRESSVEEALIEMYLAGVPHYPNNTFSEMLLHLLKKSIRMIGVKLLVRPHEGDEVLGLAEIYDIMRPTGDHVNGLDLLTADFKVDFFVRMDITLLDQRATADDNEKLPLRIMPVLTLGDTGLRNIHAELTVVGGFQQLGKGTSVVTVHLQRKLEIRRRKIAQIQAVQLLREAAVRNRRHHQRGVLRFELFEQIDDLAERDRIGQRNIAVSSVWLFDGSQPVIFATLFPAFEQVVHRLDKIVYVKQLNLCVAVVDREGQIVGNGVAERGYGGVVVRAAVPHEVRETIDRDLHAVFFAVFEEQLFACELRFAVIRLAVTADQSRLNGRGQHNGRFVIVLFQCFEQLRAKTKVALHELRVILRTVHAREVEYKVRLLAILIELHLSAVNIVFIDFVDFQCRSGAVFPVTNVFQIRNQSLSDHAPSTGN